MGGAVLLFTQMFKQPLKGLVRGYYRITGSWDNPTVERIKSADAATATAEAPQTMSTVAAIQMTSSHRVEENLEAARKLLREARDARAELACLPENFSFIGLQDADKLRRGRGRRRRDRCSTS